MLNIKAKLKFSDTTELTCHYKNELHIFANSSSKAYRCASYFRVVENKKSYSFICRLVPFKEKPLSIPKLELQAPVTATRIKKKLLLETNLNVERNYF